MRLRTKTLIVIGMTLIGLVGVLSTVSSTILLRSLQHAEEQNTRQLVKGVMNVFTQTADDFSSRFSDWSEWDDTYDFIENGNNRFIQANLVPEALATLKVDLVLFINSSGKIVFGTGFDQKSQKKTPIPVALRQQISLNNRLLEHATPKDRLTGILLLPEGPMLITSQPIVTTKGTGPIRGTLIMGRYLDKAALDKLGSIIRLPLTVYPINDPQLPPDFQTARTRLSESTPMFVRSLSEDTIGGYTFFKDIYGNPALLLRVNVTRRIYYQIQKGLRYLVILVLAVGLVFGGLTLLLLERLVLSRLAHLSLDVRNIGASGDLSMRVLSRGEDELAILASTINRMLEDLEQAQRQRQESEKLYGAVLEQASESIVLVDARTKRILEANSAFEQLLGYNNSAILGLTLYNVVADRSENIDTYIQHIRQGERSILGERRFRRQDGSLVDVEVSANLISYERREVLCMLVRDITERKRADEALRQAEERYRQIFENATGGIFQVTPEGQYISANPALAKIYGYSSPEELVANITNIWEQLYVDPNRRADFATAISDRDAVLEFESLVYRKNRSVIWISETVRAVRDAYGQLLYYEGTVEEITKRKVAQEALRYQQEQTEHLLLNILPEPIAQRLKMAESTIADSFAQVTVLFADIVGFTQLSTQIPPAELVELLNKIFSAFDQLAEQHELEKIKTIGDAYMVVGGLPVPRTDHAAAIAQMALDMLQEIARFKTADGNSFSIRIGINTGPVVAGVIGIKKFIYDLWGDTVNIASRMESQGLPDCIQVTEATYELLRDQYHFVTRGVIDVKGKGKMTTYLLTGRRVESSKLSESEEMKNAD